MAKIVLTDTAGGYNLSAINSNLTKIAQALNEAVLYRDNPVGEPNQMDNLLDMNSNRIINLPEPVTGNEPARLQDVLNAIAGVDQANLIKFTPAGSISATTVQGAIEELDAEKLGAPQLIDTTDVAKGDALVGVKNTATGGVARTQHQKNAENVWASDFGAVGNGVADDTVAIQNAINALPLGGTLNFSPGTYKLSGALTIKSKTAYYGPGATLLQTANNTQIFKGVSLNNVFISKLNFTGVGYNDTAPTDTVSLYYSALATGVYIDGGANLYISDCSFNNFLNSGITVGFADNVFIRNNVITGTFQGPGDLKTPPANGSFAAFGIYLYTGGSTAASGLGNFYVEGNTVRTTCHGIFTGPGFTNINITDNSIYNLAQHGLYINPGSKVVIKGNKVSQVYGDGIKVQSTNAAMFGNPDGIVVDSNSCTNAPNGVWGIIVDCITNVGDAVTSIYHQSVIVANNTIYNFGSGGIYCGHARNAKISNNSVQAIAGLGILTLGFEGEVSNNNVINVFGAAIAVSPEPYNTAVIRGNRINGSNLTTAGGTAISSGVSGIMAIIRNTFWSFGSFGTNNGNIYVVSVQGTTAATGGPTGIGTIVDGGVTWIYIDTIANFNGGYVDIIDNKVVDNNLADLSLYSIFIGAGGIKLNWKDNVFPLTKRVNLGNATIVGDDNNVFGGYVTPPAYVGPIQGHAFRQYTGSAIPLTGFYQAGDIVWNVVPTAGTNIGWVCVTAGTVGTWKTFGAIAA